MSTPVILSDDTAVRGAWWQLTLIALAEFLAMTLWFSATAVTPSLVRELALSPGESAWLTMAVQVGFVAGTLAGALVNVADLVSAPRLVCAGACVAAAANLAVLSVDSGVSVTLLRAATGVGLAAVYPPAMKLAASWFRRRRGFALGLLIGALTLGKAFPYLITTWLGNDWRSALQLTSALAVAGGGLVLAFGREGPHTAATVRFDPHALRRLLAVRGVRLALVGYLGHMWELYAMWTWVGVFATASFTAAGLGPSAATAGTLAAFLAIGMGALGCAVAGAWADAWGKARVARWSMLASAACALATLAVYGRAPVWTFALVMLWGLTVVADSAQFSALVSEYAPAPLVGTALTFQTSLGFLLTMVTIDGVPRLAGVVGWQYAALLLIPGPLVGAAAMRALSTTPASVECAPSHQAQT
ncbi:MAG: MFS transporter [Acidobacteria bacterium]|nr:MFS transporter [Acidobacteriota bacterium]